MSRRIPPPPGYVPRQADANGTDHDDGNEPDDDDEQVDDKGSDDGDGDGDDTELRPSERSSNKAHRDAAKYRSQRNRERREHATTRERAEAAESALTSLRMEIAFTRTAGDTFVDSDAAWKLLDRALISIEDDGSVTGMDEAVADLIERQPFIVRSDDSESTPPERNPFTASRSGRSVGRSRPKPETANRAALVKKYPALRDR